MAKDCKYEKWQKYISYDSGVTWTATSEYRIGSLIESASTDCQESPFKWLIEYSGGGTSSASCDSTSAITNGEITSDSYTKSNIVSIVIGNCVTGIGECAFCEYRNLTSVTIPNSVTSIGNGAFENCRSLSSITIPNSVTSIGDFAFNVCRSLETVIIPDSVQTIGYSGFSQCSALTSVVIGSGVTSVGRNLFTESKNLSTLRIMATVPPDGGENMFNNQDAPDTPTIIYVPCASVYAYKTCSPPKYWSNYANNITC